MAPYKDMDHEKSKSLFRIQNLILYPSSHHTSPTIPVFFLGSTKARHCEGVGNVGISELMECLAPNDKQPRHSGLKGCSFEKGVFLRQFFSSEAREGVKNVKWNNAGKYNAGKYIYIYTYIHIFKTSGVFWIVKLICLWFLHISQMVLGMTPTNWDGCSSQDSTMTPRNWDLLQVGPLNHIWGKGTWQKARIRFNSLAKTWCCRQWADNFRSRLHACHLWSHKSGGRWAKGKDTVTGCTRHTSHMQKRLEKHRLETPSLHVLKTKHFHTSQLYQPVLFRGVPNKEPCTPDKGVCC